MKSNQIHARPSLTIFCTGLTVFLTLLVGCTPKERASQGQQTALVAPSGTATAEAAAAALVDDFGPAALDHLSEFEMVVTGTPVVLLSQEVSAAQLVCLGLGWANWASKDQSISRELVVFGGHLVSRDHLGWNPPILGGLRYLLEVFEKDTRTLVAAGGPDWGRLRHTYGNSALPQDHPLYVSPEGVPSLVDLAPEEPAFPVGADASDLVWGRAGQDLSVSKSQNGWTVTVSRVHATTSWVMLTFTVSGPDRSYTVETPTLSTPGGSSLATNYTGIAATFDGTYAGPTGHLVAFRAGDSPISAQAESLRFEVPAIHVRSVFTPCANYVDTILPTPTIIPDNIIELLQQVTPQPTPPDLETVGPFTFDLQVHIEPSTPTPVLPTAVPTQPSKLSPPPVPTGQ